MSSTSLSGSVPVELNLNAHLLYSGIRLICSTVNYAHLVRFRYLGIHPQNESCSHGSYTAGVTEIRDRNSKLHGWVLPIKMSHMERPLTGKVVCTPRSKLRPVNPADAYDPSLQLKGNHL